jgi:hypothetical protein
LSFSSNKTFSKVLNILVSLRKSSTNKSIIRLLNIVRSSLLSRKFKVLKKSKIGGLSTTIRDRFCVDHRQASDHGNNGDNDNGRELHVDVGQLEWTDK